MSNLLLLSNMYPDETHPSKGVFVRNAELQLTDAGLKVHRIVVTNTQTNSRLAKLWAYLIFTSTAVIRLMRHSTPVYLHYVAHTGLPLILTQAFRSQPLIAHAHGGDVISAPHQSKVTRGLKRFLSSRVLGMANTVIVPSQFLANRLVDDYGVPAAKIVIIPSGGVDTDTFHYRERQTKESNEYLRVGYVGRLDKGKGVDTLIHAIYASKLPIKCTIVGTGSAHDSMLKLITHLKLTDQISVLGSCEQDKLGDIYRNLDFLVFPSELEESLGLVGLEAMSCGTPVIGSRKGGMAEYIAPDVNGLAFAPGNAESLASAMKEAFTMSSQAYADMSSNAHQTSKAYDARHCAERLVQVFS